MKAKAKAKDEMQICYGCKKEFNKLEIKALYSKKLFCSQKCKVLNYYNGVNPSNEN